MFARYLQKEKYKKGHAMTKNYSQPTLDKQINFRKMGREGEDERSYMSSCLGKENRGGHFEIESHFNSHVSHQQQSSYLTALNRHYSKSPLKAHQTMQAHPTSPLASRHQNQQYQSLVSQRPSKHQNNNEKLYALKFIKEFEVCLHSIMGQQNDRKPEDHSVLQEQYLDFGQFKTVLTRMGFLGRTQHKTAYNGVLQDIWELIDGNYWARVLKRNLCQMLLCVLGLFFDLPGMQLSRSRNAAVQVGEMKEGIWTLAEEEAKSLKARFNALYQNRLAFENQEKKIQHKFDQYYQEEQERSQAGMSEKSEQLALRHRRREESQAEEMLGHQQKNKLNPQQWQTALFQQRQRSRQQLKQQQDKQQSEKCTFRPKVNASSLPKEEKRYERLYKQSKEKKSAAPMDMQQRDYDRQKAQCTFTPDLQKSRHSKQNSLNKQPVKNMDKSVDRIRKGYQQRMEKSQGKVSRGNSQQNQEQYYSVCPPQKLEESRLANNFLSAQHDPHTDKLIAQELFRPQEEDLPKETRRIDGSSGKKVEGDPNYNMFFEGSYNNMLEENFYQHFQPEEKQSNESTKDNKVLVATENTQETRKAGEYLQDHFILTEHTRQAAGEEPMLYVDVNLGHNKQQRIIVYSGDKTDQLAREFSQLHNLDIALESRLKDMLDQQISSFLDKIEEDEEQSDHMP